MLLDDRLDRVDNDCELVLLLDTSLTLLEDSELSVDVDVDNDVVSDVLE